ncbi:hypothetical protein EU244_027865 [Rhodococcus qingshengii]|nr:hypothetical protein [Rhodococcus qingshengii]
MDIEAIVAGVAEPSPISGAAELVDTKYPESNVLNDDAYKTFLRW